MFVYERDLTERTAGTVYRQVELGGQGNPPPQRTVEGQRDLPTQYARLQQKEGK